MEQLFELKFWGVRGSFPTARRDTLGFGGNTASVELVTPFARILFDAGTGIIPLGRTLGDRTKLPLILFLSHWHHDHLQGLPFFAPLFDPTARLTLAAPGKDTAYLTTRLRQVMSPPQFPVAWNETRAVKELVPLKNSGTLYLSSDGALGREPGRETITLCYENSAAHPGGITLFRVEYRGLALVYATDIEADTTRAPEIIAFARNADILIHDAQYQRAHYLGQPPFSIATRGYGHSTNVMAAAIAREANVKQLVLFHHEPNYNDDTIALIQSQTRVLFSHTRAAYEGMTIHFRVNGKGAKNVRFAALDAFHAPTL